jgi:hypothetical protein
LSHSHVVSSGVGLSILISMGARDDLYDYGMKQWTICETGIMGSSQTRYGLGVFFSMERFVALEESFASCPADFHQ